MKDLFHLGKNNFDPSGCTRGFIRLDGCSMSLTR